MTNEQATWTDTSLGQMPGLGNARPRGGAEIKAELDPGLAVVRYLYDNSRVDAEWSVREERGFTWWADGLAQRVWCDPGFDDEGIEIHRLFVETDLVRGVEDATESVRAADSFNGLTAGSALVFEPQAGTIRSVASMWVHEQSVEWIARSLSVIGAIQVAQAQQQATMLVPMAGGELALSAHPESGPRPEPDEMLGVLEIVRMDGRAAPGWAGEQMAVALEQLRALPAVVLASGDDEGITLEVPYGQATALIQLDTSWAHPDLGAGLLARLSLPGDAAPGPESAARRNRQELAALTRAHFTGGWIGSGPFAVYLSFFPNMLSRTGLGVTNIALSMIGRARWTAEDAGAGAS
jgi:hypothetical protein